MLVPKDKAVKRFHVRNIVDASAIRDLQDSSTIDGDARISLVVWRTLASKRAAAAERGVGAAHWTSCVPASEDPQKAQREACRPLALPLGWSGALLLTLADAP